MVLYMTDKTASMHQRQAFCSPYSHMIIDILNHCGKDLASRFLNGTSCTTKTAS